MTTKKTAAKKPAPKKKKVEEQEYQEFNLNTNLAYSRAAIYLEEAGDVAVSSRSIEGMLTVAKGWMELGDMLDTGQAPPKRAKLGFGLEEGDDND